MIRVCSFRTKRMWMAGVFVFICLCLCTPATAADQKIVTAIGSAPAQGEDMSAAKNAAIEKGLSAALEQVVAGILSTDTIINNFGTLNQVVFSKPSQYVQDYRVLVGAKTGKLYRVLLQATVVADRILESMGGVGISATPKGLPGVLILVNEQNPESDWPQFWWAEDTGFLVTAGEKALSEKLRERGFALIGHDYSGPRSDLEPFLYKPNLSNDEAIALGKLYKADMVIVGSAVARPSMNTMGESLQSYKGIVTLRVIRPDTGEALAPLENTAVAANADPVTGGRDAILEAGKLAGDAVADQITKAWHKIRKPEMVEINVLGTSNLPAFVQLRRVITATAGVKSLTVKEIQPNQALIIADYQSDAEELAASMMVNDFGRFGVRMTDIEARHITIEIISEESPEAAPQVETPQAEAPKTE